MKKVVLWVFVLAFLTPFAASAGTGDNIAGYAWSPTAGWISFNCTNDSTCATSDYGVNKNGDGTITGYAWSSSIGWIKFGGLSSFPSGSGTTASNAIMSGSNLVGWAKALSADGLGWDGWISLSGTGYGITFSGTKFSGYAWGADVIGWMLFDVDTQYPAICGSCGVAITGDATLDIKSSGSTIVGNWAVPYNTAPTFEWTLTNISGATCSVSKAASSTGSTSFTTISGITSTGSYVAGAHTTGLYTYNIDCINPTISHQIGFGVATQPAGFSLGGTESVNIQFLTAGAADSEQKSIFVSAVGGFITDVAVDVLSSTCPGTPTYSLGGAAFVANPSPVTISNPYNSGTTFRVHLGSSIASPCIVTLIGTAPSYTSATKDLTITPVPYDPAFDEH